MMMIMHLLMILIEIIIVLDDDDYAFIRSVRYSIFYVVLDDDTLK